MMTNLDKGIRAAVSSIGSKAELARKLRISPQAVSQWKRVPTNRVMRVEKVTGVPIAKLLELWLLQVFAGATAPQCADCLILGYFHRTLRYRFYEKSPCFDVTSVRADDFKRQI